MSIQPDIVMTGEPEGLSAAETAQAVASRKLSALAATEAALARIAKHDPILNSFTDVTADRARAPHRDVVVDHANGVDAHLFQHLELALKGAGVNCGAQRPQVVMIANTIDLYALAVQKKSLVAVERKIANAQKRFIRIDQVTVGFDP